MVMNKCADHVITIGDIVYEISNPGRRGPVMSIAPVGDKLRYGVFADGEMRQYYDWQIAVVPPQQPDEWVDVGTFSSRLAAYQINHPTSESLYSLHSARIEFVPYQFRPVLKLIRSDVPRLLIADSVGVGKTIEAGLIIKELEARGSLDRVLVICPRPLVAERKWEMEMRRFDENFTPLDGDDLRMAIRETERDGEWPLRYGRSIIPYSILDRRTYIGKRKDDFCLCNLDPPPMFDLVIIDEAHHIRNGSMEAERAFAYKCCKYFADHSNAVIMLTATPIQMNDNDLFTVLNVLRPDIIIDNATFCTIAEPNAYITEAVRQERAGKDGWEMKAVKALSGIEQTEWGKKVISRSPAYQNVIDKLKKGVCTREERVRLITETESLHTLDSIITRTRRRDIQDFCVRHNETVEVAFTPAQQSLYDKLMEFVCYALSLTHDVKTIPFMVSTLRRQAASCIFGLGPCIRDIIQRRIEDILDDDTVWSGDVTGNALPKLFVERAQQLIALAESLPSEDPKYDKVLGVIMRKQTAANNKIMLFSTFRHTLAYLQSKLKNTSLRVGQIDGSVKDETRYELRRRFELPREDESAIDLMLFTEVGSEGLDYQFCNTMINYDLPWNPMRIEQRIGRIDRRGQQSEAVNIVNVITEGTVDQDIYSRCLVRIGIFERNIGDCEVILGEIGDGIEQIAADPKLTDEERREKLEQLADNAVRKQEEMERLEQEEHDLFGFDLSDDVLSMELRDAENPWLTQDRLYLLVKDYIAQRTMSGAVQGGGALKTLRLNADDRITIGTEYEKLPRERNAASHTWESYLRGKKPTCVITFKEDAAENAPEALFITPMHPLARQAAAAIGDVKPGRLKLELSSGDIRPGLYPFAIYMWEYVGEKTRTKLVPICENEEICEQIPHLIQEQDSHAKTAPDVSEDSLRSVWDGKLEEIQLNMLMAAVEECRGDSAKNYEYKRASLEHSFKVQKTAIQRKIDQAQDEKIQRMHKGELINATARYEAKLRELEENRMRSDIHSSRLAMGVVEVTLK